MNVGDSIVTVDHGDGTGTRTVYDDHGQIVSTETIYGLEIPVPPEPSPEERIAELEAVISTLLGD